MRRAAGGAGVDKGGAMATAEATLVQVGQLREALATLLAVLGHGEGCGAYTAPCRCWQRRPVGLAVAALRETGGLPDWLGGYEHGED
jgi:hypothetical protein